MAKAVDNLEQRTKLLFNGQDEAGTFYRRIFADVFAYVANRVPEIADEPYRIDDALRAGFGWELGAFESWDAIGFEDGLKAIAERGLAVPAWIETFKAQSEGTFYRNVDGVRQCWDPRTGAYEAVGGQEGRLSLAWLPDSATVWSNSGTTIQDLGDGILNVAFHTKMNSIGAEVLEGVNKAMTSPSPAMHGRAWSYQTKGRSSAPVPMWA